ncbi:MAG: tripartite tricarboxylate transporter TctB family protein [Thermodesulfobacteriota bacterium]
MSGDKRSAIAGLIMAFLIIYLGSREGVPVGTLSKPGTGFFPLILGATLGILCLMLLLSSLGKSTRREEKKGTSSLGKRRVALTFGVLLAYGLLLEPLGFLLCTFFLMFVVLKLVAGQRWSYSLLTSLLTTVASYVVFQKLLQTQLPPGILGLLGLY